MMETEIMRKPIKYPRVELNEMLEEVLNAVDNHTNAGIVSEDLKIVNVRGTNGSGKSTIPMKMIEDDRSVFIVVDNSEEVATVIPKYKTVALGTYRRKTGGLDGIRNTARMKELLEKVKYLDLNILMEGILASTVFSTYRDIFHAFETEHFVTRKAVVLSLLPPFDEVKKRVLERNGGKEVKWEQVYSKYETVERNAKKFHEAGILSIIGDNASIGKDDTLEWFFDVLKAGGIEWNGR